MKAQDLRNSILQLAIQGKLVPQNSNDEPADVLYAKIQAEKQKLIKTGKIKKDKPLPSISEDEIPFEIPSSWKWVRFGEIVNYNMGKTPSRNNYDYWGDKYSWVSIADMVNNGIIDTTKDMLSQKAYNDVFKGNMVLKGTLLMSFKLTIGKISILGIDAFHNEAIISIFPFVDKNKITTKFLFCLLPYLTTLTSDTKTAIKGNTLNSSSINKLLVPLPPLEEQKRIVAKIEELEPYVKEYDKVENELSELNNKFPEQLRKSVLQYAVQGKLVPQNSNDEPAEILYKKIKAEKEKLIKEGKIKKGENLPPIEIDEIPFKIPSTWKWVRFIDLTCKIGSGSTPLGGKQAYLDRGVKFIRSQNVYNDGLKLKNIAYISEDTNKKMRLTQVHSNDLLLNITGASIGRCCIVPKDFDIGNVNQHVSIIRMILDNINKYVHIYITSPYFYAKIMNTQVGMSREGLSKASIEKMLIPLPPFEEQCRIVAKVDELFACCNKLESAEKYIIEKSVEPINNEWLIDKSNELYEQDGWVNPDRILDELGIVTILDRSLNKGRIEYVNNQFRICLRDRNDNWTKVHELVHYANDNAEIKLYGAVGRKDETSLSKSKEVNTDAITAEILMPENAVINFLKQENIKLNGLVVDKAIRKMAKQFKVSDVAVKIRLQNMNYKTK